MFKNQQKLVKKLLLMKFNQMVMSATGYTEVENAPRSGEKRARVGTQSCTPRPP